MTPSIAIQRGLVLYHQKRYALAAEEFRKALAVNPQNARALAMLGLSLMYDGKVAEGIEQTKHAVAAEPEYGFAYYAMACALVGPLRRVPIGRRRAYRRRVRDARVPAMEALRLEPRNPDFLALLGAIALDLRQPKEALHWAELGLAARADHLRSANVRARALGKLGRKKEARVMVETALALAPEDASSHTAGGWTSLQASDPRRAVEHFRESVRLDPTNPEALNGLATARVKAAFEHPLAYIITLSFVVGMGILPALWPASPRGVSDPPSFYIVMGLGCFLAFLMPIGVAFFIRRRR